MKKNLVFNFSLLVALLIAAPVCGQNEASKELDPLIGMPLKEAHSELHNNGYEIAQSSIFNAKQMWYNESKNQCVTIIFSKEENHQITSIEPSKENKCIRGVKASRRVWASYIDGGASESSSAIDKERDILRSQGYSVSYWIRDVSPGKTAEIWYNESKKLCKMIVWDKANKANVKLVDRDPRLGKNPAPVYNVSVK